MKPKQPGEKVRALFKKLQALAERGIDGERAVAQAKLARLKARYNFNASPSVDASDLFSGTFSHSSSARKIYTFQNQEMELANSVKWAIESATKIHCVHRSADLLAEATPTTARKLAGIADHIAQSFRVLIGQFHALKGVSAADRSAFLMGLYDGMMNEVRDVGQRLPGGFSTTKRRGKKSPAGSGAGLHLHPYSIAVRLGKQIRFSASLEQITAELQAATTKRLTQEGG